VTDAGVTGDYDSIIGMQKEEPLRRFTTGIPSGRFEPAMGAATLSGVAVETDDATGLALRITPSAQSALRAQKIFFTGDYFLRATTLRRSRHFNKVALSMQYSAGVFPPISL
jgi:hypothetical protein